MLHVLFYTLIYCSDIQKKVVSVANSNEDKNIEHINSKQAIQPTENSGISGQEDAKNIINPNISNKEGINKVMSINTKSPKQNKDDPSDATINARDGFSGSTEDKGGVIAQVNSKNTKVISLIDGNNDTVKAEIIIISTGGKIEKTKQQEHKNLSDALLVNLNQAIEDYNVACNYNKDKENLVFIERVAYNFVQITWMYKEKLKLNTALNKEFQRAEIIYYLLLQEKRKIDIYNQTQDVERKSHIESNDLHLRIKTKNLENLITKNATEPIKKQLIGRLVNTWKICNFAQTAKTERQLSYHMYSLNQTVYEIHKIAHELLENVKSNNGQTIVIQEIENMCDWIMEIKKDIKSCTIIRYENYTNSINEYETRLRQLMVSLYNGPKAIRNEDVEKEIKEIYSTHYEVDGVKKYNPYEDLNGSNIKMLNFDEEKQTNENPNTISSDTNINNNIRRMKKIEQTGKPSVVSFLAENETTNESTSMPWPEQVKIIDSKIWYVEKLLIFTFVICLITMVFILGAAWRSYWKS